LRTDLNKAPLETFLTETGIVMAELHYALKHISRWVKPRRARTPLALFAATTRIYREPFGVVLIMSPWNYPFQLAFDPLVGALAAGNCAVVKPGSYAPKTAEIIATIIAECFPPEYVACVLGGRQENTLLLDQNFDFIFFTGNADVGRTVLTKAAVHLTPVVLELGGKSPCIIAEGADLRLAAKRIAFGKFVNAGQTCVAPDYVLIRPIDKEAFIRNLKIAIDGFFGPDPLSCPDYPKIINDKHRERLKGLLQGMNAVIGGTGNDLQIAPTVLDGVRPEDPVMQEEIFGPILPILTYHSYDEAIAFVNTREKPLALYLFGSDRSFEHRVITEISFGGGTFNDTLMHVASSAIGFGGVGNSGMGNYHGKRSFDTFSHEKPIVRRANWIDLDLRYHPYTEKKSRMAHRFLK
ncbi:MAG: aldehyde dehydrogenase family protein, partial [bacterium]